MILVLALNKDGTESRSLFTKQSYKSQVLLCSEQADKVKD